MILWAHWAVCMLTTYIYCTQHQLLAEGTQYYGACRIKAERVLSLLYGCLNLYLGIKDVVYSISLFKYQDPRLGPRFIMQSTIQYFYITVIPVLLLIHIFSVVNV